MAARRTGDDERDLWVQTTALGWSGVPEASDYLRQAGPVMADRGMTFLAELDGRAIEAGALLIFEGVGLLAGACTIPEASKRGAQLALLNARLGHAAECGCDLAMVRAEPGSATPSATVFESPTPARNACWSLREKRRNPLTSVPLQVKLSLHPV